MSTDQTLRSVSDQSRHQVQNSLLGTALLLTLAQTQPALEFMRQQLPSDRTPQLVQSEPSPNRETLSQEEKDLGRRLQLENELRMHEARTPSS